MRTIDENMDFYIFRLPDPQLNLSVDMEKGNVLFSSFPIHCYPQMTQIDADERHEDLTGIDRICRIRNWVGSAVPADRFDAFRRSCDQRLAVGSRPAGRRRQVGGNNFLFAVETRTVPGSPSRPSSRTFLEG